MGTCYSCQARISKPTYPSDMSLTSDSSSKKGSHRLTSNAFTGHQEKSSRLRPPSSSSTSSVGVPKQTLRGSKSSSEKLNTSGESGIVLTVENTHNKYQRIQNANERKAAPNPSGPRRGKFGFASKPKATATNGQRSDANRNLMDVSSDSLDSIDSKRSSSSVTGGGGDVGDGGSLRKKNLNSSGAYSPKEGGRWKMIDDSESTTTDTKSVSTHGRSEHDLAKDTNGNAVTPTRVPQNKQQQGSNKLTGTAGSRLKKPTSRLRPPQSSKAPLPQKSGRQWVKAGPVEMEEQTKASSVDRAKCPQDQQIVPPEPTATTNGKSKTRRAFFQRGKGRLQFSHGDRYSANNEDNKLTHVTPDSGLGETMVEDEISKTVESMLEGVGDNKKDVKHTINVLSKDIASANSNELRSDDLATDGGIVDDIENKLSEQLAGQKLNSSNDLLDDVDSYLEEAPRARLDSLGSCSISSLNSDDLMLETDMLDDVYNQSSCSSLDKTLLAGTTTTKTRTQPRSVSDALSMSQPASGIAKLDKRPVVRRLDSSGYWRQGSLKSSSSVEGGSRERRLRTQSSTNEAVTELSNMMGAGASGVPPTIQRRPPKFSRERPASFPGPLSADGVARPERTVQFRQRGKAPSISDEEHVYLDAPTYRTMIQELTDCKTMIFKLKRVIQQEEIGSPFGNHTFAGTLKNGYNKFGGSGSTPGSPLVSVDCNESFAFVEPKDIPNAEVLQENAELRQQLQTMQQQLDEQDRTIKLLQQQMTKYECGHYGADAQACTNATTQTDKPRLAVPKNILRPSAGGAHAASASGASSGSGEPIISSRRYSNPKEDNDAAASGEKPAKPKSQLPVGAGTTRVQRATGSRLPAMRIQRYSKGQPQLQSFTKIAQPQPAN